MTTNISAILFDFGNVLLEWNPRYVYRRYFPNDEQAMERFLHEVDFTNWNLQQDKGRSFKEGIALLSKQFPHYAELIQAYRDNWIESIAGHMEGTVEIMHRLKMAGYSLYGLSNWSAETFPIAREQYDFFDLLDDIILSGEVGSVKPEPKIFNIALQRIGKPANECLFIDDSLANIEQARRMGFITIHFQSATQLAEQLHELGLL